MVDFFRFYNVPTLSHLGSIYKPVQRERRMFEKVVVERKEAIFSHEKTNTLRVGLKGQHTELPAPSLTSKKSKQRRARLQVARK